MSASTCGKIRTGICRIELENWRSPRPCTPFWLKEIAQSSKNSGTFSLLITKNSCYFHKIKTSCDSSPMSKVMCPRGTSKIKGACVLALSRHFRPQNWYLPFLGRLWHIKQAFLALSRHVRPHCGKFLSLGLLWQYYMNISHWNKTLAKGTYVTPFFKFCGTGKAAGGIALQSFGVAGFSFADLFRSSISCRRPIN